jgi:hypothetical protein
VIRTRLVTVPQPDTLPRSPCIWSKSEEVTGGWRKLLSEELKILLELSNQGV